MIEVGLLQLLTSTPRISALVSARVYPLILPNETKLPAITYQVVGSASEYTQDGATGFRKVSIEVSAWAEDYGATKAITAAVRATLDGYMGQLPNGVKVLNVMQDNESDYFEKEARLYRTQTDWEVLYAGPVACS